MDQIRCNDYSYDRLVAAMNLVKFKAEKDKLLYKSDVNEALVVAGMDIIQEDCQKEVEVMEVTNG